MTTQNPFLKKNSENSRFSREHFFVNEEPKNTFSKVKEKKDTLNKSINDNSNKDKKSNSFLQDNRKDNKHISNFKNNTRNDHKVNTKNEFNVDMEEFPALTEVNAKEIITPAPGERTFIDIINTITIVENDNKDTIKPGWIVISKNKDTNKNEITYGEITPYQFKLQQREQDISYIMHSIEKELNILWNRNIALYDAINGEGAYEERFYLPPVYNDFEDYDDENEFDEQDIEMDNDYYISDSDYSSDYN